jgi:hypothetical protein
MKRNPNRERFLIVPKGRLAAAAAAMPSQRGEHKIFCSSLSIVYSHVMFPLISPHELKKKANNNIDFFSNSSSILSRPRPSSLPLNDSADEKR